jgi:DNA-binding response OmpR family regulator
MSVGRSIDETRESIIVSGELRRLSPTLWRLFKLLHRHRGSLVRYHLIANETGIAASALREHTRRLRKQLNGSQFQLVTHRGLGLELLERR